MQSGVAIQVCNRYLSKATGLGKDADVFRDVVLQLYEGGKIGLKKGEVLSAVQSSSKISPDNCSRLYSIVMKDICTMKGSSWILKNGD